MKKRLEKSKTWTIKNCVYSNIDIPQIWQNKLTYHDEMMKIISDDNNFFSYLAHSQPENKEREKKFIETSRILESKEKSNEESLKNKSFYHEGDKTNFLDKSKSRVFSNVEERVNEDTKEREESPKITRTTRKRTLKNKIYSEKEKRDILDQFRETFKMIKRVPNELENKELLTNNTNYHTGFNLPNISKSSKFELKETVSDLREKIDPAQKSKMFKSSIYSLFFPIKSKPTNLSKSQASNLKNSKETPTTYGPFLNVTYEYDKKIEIKNPEVKRLLDDVNYYGPYYSHCPSCRNRNLEFYQTIDPPHCLDILNYIKKSRKNKSLFEIKK